MAEEEKGFVLKDRRSFDEKGEMKKEEAREKEPSGKEESKRAAAEEDAGGGPLPEVNFSSLIFSLSSSALLHFGDIADPQTGAKKKDLALAKHTIDILAMLKDKTKGNLTDEEDKFLENILTDLRWRYVKATK